MDDEIENLDYTEEDYQRAKQIMVDHIQGRILLSDRQFNKLRAYIHEYQRRVLSE